MSEPLFLASTNEGKRAEFAALLAERGLEIGPSLAFPEVDEDAPDYLGNAALKAEALRDELVRLGSEATVFADDSGLEVDALDGAPGVRSARYGGLTLTWPQRRARLLAAIAAVPTPQRSARFHCALLAIDAEGRRYVGFGETRGSIALAERGDTGFGYDPLFLPEGEARTFAEMSAVEKARTSHRARALHALLAAMGR
ncbi:MAG: non-canonical purine NTP pyrophosphatase [Candidatus Eremiobacteraeota bacterium]|nr:non-canonical purine NTP pyrophosphatase [Candidatus Eremiobacteraeota bacterium]